MGSRTVERVTKELTKLPSMSLAKRGGTWVPKDLFCESVCEMLCQKRDDMLVSLFKDMPYSENVIRDMTDFKTVVDLNKGGGCSCNCPIPDDFIEQLIKDKGD